MRILLARCCANLYNKTAMTQHLRLVLFALILAAVMTTEGSAENFSGEPDIFDDIKAQLMNSSRGLKDLVDENKTLKARLISLQLEIEQYEQELEEADPEYMRARRAGKEQAKRSSGWSDPEGDDLVREAQNIYLSGQAIPLDGVQKLRELQLYDLQYQKQELDLDLKSLEFLHEKVGEQRRSELEALENTVRENAEKNGDLLIKISQEEAAARNHSKHIKLLERENKGLKKRIDQLKKLLKKGPRY